MPKDLPSELWMEILEQELSHADFCNLALTSRQLNQIAVPVLYNSFEFDAQRFIKDKIPPTALWIYFYKRICFLASSPHLLCHVKELTLSSWAIHLPVSEDSASNVADASLQGVIYELLGSLALQMPNLQTLWLGFSAMTPRLHLAACAPHLHTLKLDIYRMGNLWSLPAQNDSVVNIQHLTYRPEDTEDTTADGFFTHIIVPCIFSLKTLDAPGDLLSFITAGASEHPLPLRKLFVSFATLTDNLLLEMWEFFRLCPMLQSISVRVWNKSTPFTVIDAPPLPSGILPNLQSISATCGVIRVFTTERSISDIKVTGRFDPRVSSIRDIIGCSRPNLQKLTIEVFLAESQDLLAFLISIRGCHNLEDLYVTVDMSLFSMEEHKISVEFRIHIQGELNQPFSIQDILRGVEEELLQLTSLRTFRLTSLWHTFGSGEVVCPIGVERDPRKRGHPCLQEVSVTAWDGFFTWVWVYKEGWTLQDDGYRYPRAPLEPLSNAL